MSFNNFIPTVWASDVLLNLHKAQVWAQPDVVNNDYEGDIADMGDTVRIGAIGAVTISKYQKNVRIGLPQVLSDASTTLTIDQGDFFNFAVDDVDKAQARGNLMSAGMYEAGYGISDSADRFVASIAYPNASLANIIGTDTSPQTDLAPSSNFTKAYDYLVDLGVLLDKANVPKPGRWVIVPPFYAGLLQRDLRFVGYGTTANREVLEGGLIGMAAGFTIRMSNNVQLTNTTTYNVVAGTKLAISYADQIVQVEAFRHPELFSDAVKGLHVYGAKVVRPNSLAVLKCTDPGF